MYSTPALVIVQQSWGPQPHPSAECPIYMYVLNLVVFFFQNVLTVAQLQLSPLPPPSPSPLAFNAHPLRCPCPWVLVHVPWLDLSPPFPPLPNSPLPCGYCQFVLCFHVSGSYVWCVFDYYTSQKKVEGREMFVSPSQRKITKDWYYILPVCWLMLITGVS